MTDPTPHSAIPILQSNVLIVEDSPIEAELLRRSLVRAGYLVTVTRNGEEGLQSARASRPALVVSDINMPLMDGYQLCHALKYDDTLWNVPVILLTALSEAKDIMLAIDVGADSYITKPFVESILLERVRSLLDTPVLRKRSEERRSERVEYHGEHYTITGGSQQVLNLLLSVYENSLAQNHELARVQSQLNLLNADLDDQVRERTAELLLEKQNMVRTNRALRTLSACNVALVRARTEEELFQNICRHIVEIGGYRMAWIGLSEDDEQKTVRPVAHSGFEQGYLEKLHITWADTERGRGPTGRAIRSGQPVHSASIATDPEFAPWREDALARGYTSSLALPLINEGVTYGALNIYAADGDAFGADELSLMQELAGDTAYGIVTLRTRAERDRARDEALESAARLRKVFEQTISAIALTLEKRDPYTAGHQQRVAQLATAIATEMGLPQQQTEGIYLGALLHNIGTVSVPAEILNRPGKLTELQFALIKQHALTGFEIVKDIPFPWPVADMVLQHHERMDGSGYPQGLVNGEIMLEAQIIAVADVLEALLAYRPYRPALHQDEALALLEQGRGTLFDSAVVDACLRVVQRGESGVRNAG